MTCGQSVHCVCASAVYTYTLYTLRQNLTVNPSLNNASTLAAACIAVCMQWICQYGKAHMHACLRRPDKREVLANQVGILMPSRVLCLQPLSTPFDPHYRLATRQDVKQNMQSLCEVMPAWELAHLGDGWVDGTAYGSKIG